MSCIERIRIERGVRSDLDDYSVKDPWYIPESVWSADWLVTKKQPVVNGGRSERAIGVRKVRWIVLGHLKNSVKDNEELGWLLAKESNGARSTSS